MSLMPVDDALLALLDGVLPRECEWVPLEEANGRKLAQDLVSKRTQPPFAASAMDGYAVRHEDASKPDACLTVIGEAPAGHAFQGTVGSGEAVRIFTGAPVPDSADTILIQENAERTENQVRVVEAPTKGRFVRAAGLDFSLGDTLIKAGKTLNYRDLALAAAMNHAVLPVVRKPVVAVLATGDELVRPGGEPGPDQIIASNHAGIAGLVEDCGGIPLDLGISPDEPKAMANYVARAIDSNVDVLITLGGASVGDHDLVQDVLGEQGMDLAFWRIAMRPGKPLMAGRLGDIKVLGLPGNPVSSLVCGLLFLKPLLAAMLGESSRTEETTAVLGADLGENDRRQDYIRAKLENDNNGQLVATPFKRQDSSMLALLAHSGALIIRPPHAPAVKAGDQVKILKL